MKFRIYTPDFKENIGGIVVLFTLGKILNDLGHECKLITFRKKNLKNEIYTNYTNENDILDCYVIYPEIIKGNPLKATKIIRWILCDLGINTDKQVYKNWNSTDIVYYYSSFNYKNKKNLKYLNCGYIFDKYLKVENENKKRFLNCYEIRKGKKFHQKLNILHNNNDTNLKLSKNHIKTFSESKYYYCYDPYTYNMVLAGFCGCIPIVQPLKNVSKKEWLETLYCKGYLEFHKKDNLYGIAYGLEDVPYAEKTLHLLKEEQINIFKFINNSVEVMINDLLINNVFTVKEMFF